MSPSDVTCTNFADRLQQAVDEKRSCLVVGLDPDPTRLPQPEFAEALTDPRGAGGVERSAHAVARFLEGVVERVAPFAAAVKPNVAFFERFGPAGVAGLHTVCEAARAAGLLVITDAKRGDIGHTAAAYAEALLGDAEGSLGPLTDAVTLNPYLGSDSLQPFLDRVREAGKGVFILVRTSNPSASELQELEVDGVPLYQRVASLVAAWGAGYAGRSGLNPVGAVVGATAPQQAAKVRELLPQAMFLVPGYGAQGAGAEQLKACFAEGGRGAVVNASRSILYAHEKSDRPWRDAVELAAREAREALERVRGADATA